MCRTERLVRSTEGNAPVYRVPEENGTYCRVPSAHSFGRLLYKVVVADEISYDSIQDYK